MGSANIQVGLIVLYVWDQQIYGISTYTGEFCSVVCKGSANIKVDLAMLYYGISKYKDGSQCVVCVYWISKSIGGSVSVVCLGSANIKVDLVMLYVWNE